MGNLIASHVCGARFLMDGVIVDATSFSGEHNEVNELLSASGRDRSNSDAQNGGAQALRLMVDAGVQAGINTPIVRNGLSLKIATPRWQEAVSHTTPLASHRPSQNRRPPMQRALSAPSLTEEGQSSSSFKPMDAFHGNMESDPATRIKLNPIAPRRYRRSSTELSMPDQSEYIDLLRQQVEALKRQNKDIVASYEGLIAERQQAMLMYQSALSASRVLPASVEELEKTLRSFGVLTEEFGKGDAKTLAAVQKELEKKDAYLQIVDRILERVVEPVIVRVYGPRRSILVNTEDLEDGRIRRRNQLLVVKKTYEETWEDAAIRSIRQKLQINILEHPIMHLVKREYDFTEETKSSTSYPGLVCRYRLHHVTCYVDHAGGDPMLASVGIKGGITLGFTTREHVDWLPRGELEHHWSWMHTRVAAQRKIKGLPDSHVQCQELRLARQPPRHTATIVVTDVEGSTKLWEALPEVMDHALAKHDGLMRELLHTWYGYEVTTGGDAFTLAFHEPEDAVNWAMDVQASLLEDVDWPQELLDHMALEDGVVPDSHENPLFRGLRVRIGMATGPVVLYEDELTKRTMYTGETCVRAEAIGELPAGGQVLLDEDTYTAAAVMLAHAPGPAACFGDAFDGVRSIRSASRIPSLGHELGGWHDRAATLATFSCSELIGDTTRSSDPLAAPPSPRSRLLAEGGDNAVRSTRSLKKVLFEGDALANANSSPKQLSYMRVSSDGADLAGETTASLSGETTASLGTIVINEGMFAIKGSPCPVFQFIPAGIAARSVLFNQLKGSEAQTSYWHAPGAFQSARLNGLAHDLRAPALDPVSAVFIGPAKLSKLEAAIGRDRVDIALGHFSKCVRATLQAHGGYLCQENRGCFMAMFASGSSSVEACLELQVKLLSLDWPRDVRAVKEVPEAEELYLDLEGQDSQVLVWSGLRAKCGVFEGTPTSIEPHRTTGRADYFGPLVNRAARLMGGSHGGQVLAETDSLKRWHSSESAWSWSPVGQCMFKGVAEPIHVSCALGEDPIFRLRTYATELDGTKAVAISDTK